MNLHEYQAKDIFRRFGITTPDGVVVTTPEGAAEAAKKFNGPVMVKAQVHSGGRGKAGGVKYCKTPDEAQEKASKILGMQIKGLTVKKVLIAPAADIASEAYIGIIVDRARKKPVFMVSAAGGMDIEEVAATTPEKIRYHAVDTRYGLLPYEALELGFFLYRDAKLARAAAKVMQQLYTVFMANGCSITEINPFVVTPAGEVMALDGKMVIDDNELDRLPEVEKLRDVESENPAEVDARVHNLTFIKLDGNVGCIVNGAGLAMATMDLVKYYGGEPANFLDIGGSSNPEKVVNALRIITADQNVKAILFNIFGGITRTDDVANGIVTALKTNPLKVPLVIRLTGTNEEIALKILADNNLKASSDMDEAVQQAVKLAGGGKAA
jgi:succinyl-CoA synthetase beta subunit